MAASEEEVAAELEAVEAVYSQDSYILQNYPPHLHIQVKPRTADVSSQQVIQSPSTYPVPQIKEKIPSFKMLVVLCMVLGMIANT